ncbi:MAG: DUF3987 domain-containing protein [Planctomycetes bacterium]|nr:DUF3987 domain-containing protein [Planctomycetota bacterium]
MTSALSKNGTPMDVRSAALAFLAAGYAPLPLPPRSKRPTVADWPRLRLAPSDVDTMFAADANLGLILGEPSGGLVDIDLDCVEAVRAASILMPRTGMISGRKSSPHSHRWYRVDSPPTKAAESFDDPVATAAESRRIIELRGGGGQTMTPPSIHPSGERCVWHEHGEPAHVNLETLRTAVRGVAAAALLGRHWPTGGRHEASLAVAGGLLRANLPDEVIERFVTAVCLAADDREVSDRIRGVRDSSAKLSKAERATGWPHLAKLLGAHGEAIVGKVREWLGVRPEPKSAVSSGERVSEVSPVTHERYTPIQPFVPFPTDCLPPPWDQFVREGASALRCDETLVALPLLAVLSGAIGNTRRVHLGAEWFEPTVLWTCPVAESGGMKTSAANLSIDLVRARQKRLVKEFKEELKAYKREMGDRKEEDSHDDAPPKPTLKRVVVADVTIEKLTSLHDDNRRGLLVARDELAGWFGSFTRYKGKGGGTDEPNWLSMHRADAIVYDRKTGDKTSVFVPYAATSLTGGIQPGVLQNLASHDLFASGMVARIIFAMPPRTPKTWSDDEISPNTRAAAESSLGELFDLKGEVDEDGDLCPIVVRLNREAKARLKQFVNAWGIRQFEAEGEKAAALAKLEALPGRFALVHHTATTSGSTDEINLASLESGIRLAEWAANETERVYAILGESTEEKKVRKLVDTVSRLAGRNDGRVSVRTLQRANQRKYQTPDQAKADLQRLVNLKVGEWELPPERASGGWRPTYFILGKGSCVTGDTSDTRPDDEEGNEDSGSGDTRPKPPTDSPRPDLGPSDASSYRGTDCGNEWNGDQNRVSEVSPVTHSPNSENEAPQTGGQAGSDCHTAKEASVTSTPILTSEQMAFMLVTTIAGISDVVTAIEDDGGMIGLDCETTGLSHATDKIRLIQLATVRGTFVIDVFAFDNPRAAFDELFEVLARAGIVGHNLVFDLPFLVRLGFTPDRVFDTILASQVMHAGDVTVRHALKDVANRVLGRALDKTEQKADWSKALTPDMLRYAATDAELPLQIRERLTPEIETAGLTATVATENAALPAMAWASLHGVGFDRPAWQTLAAEAGTRREQLREELDTAAPDATTLTNTRNWDAPNDVLAAFASVGVTIEGTDDDTLATVSHPLAALVREYRGVAKRCGTYGTEWLRHVAAGSRVFATWKQIGAGASGRMSCKEPNLQQLPRDQRYRRCFVAPPGRTLVKADYSQIELRIAAKITGDKRMVAAYRDNEDLHTLTAQALLGKQDVTKADRQLAKAVNFGLLYGQGVRGLQAYALGSFGVALTEAEATAHRNTFFRTYRELRKWHNSTQEGPVDTRTLAGRRRAGVVRYTEKLNTPVQGSGADGLKRALALLWQRREQCPGAFPVLFVHDEIVVECDEGQADAAVAWVKAAMIDGMVPLIAPIPVEVEATVGKTWGG